MATDFRVLIAELRAFDGRREVVKAASKGIRTAAKPVRKAIKAKAIEILPSSGGLGRWVSRISITAQIKLGGRNANIKLKGGRNSTGARSDIKRIDAGRVRAPSWGRRTKGSWHTQTVSPGFFTQTAADASEWRDEVDREIDLALEQIRRG